MKQAEAIRSFRRSDNKEYVRFGDILYGETRYIDELERTGLVRAVEKKAATSAPENKANPSGAGGQDQQSSASPVAQASAKVTAKVSKRGRPKKKAATSSSQTPPTK